MEYEKALMQDYEIVNALNDLIELDQNAIAAYNSAINGLEEFGDVRARLIQFRADHERHVLHLSPFVREYGGNPDKRPGAVGLLQKGWTEISRLGGASGIFSAMVMNEKNAVMTYERGAAMPFPTKILKLVEQGEKDEQRHLLYCESQLTRFETAA